MPDEPAPQEPLDSLSAVPASVVIDAPRKEPGKELGKEPEPQATRKPVYAIVVISFLILLAALVLVGMQRNTFDSWQDKLSVWWYEFSTAKPPQKNTGSIPRIPETPEAQAPVGSAQESVAPLALPDGTILGAGAPESSGFSSEDPLTPAAELLSTPAEMPKAESQLDKAPQEAGVMLDSAAGENVAQVDNSVLADDSLIPRQDLVGGEQAVAADIAHSVAPPPEEAGSLDVPVARIVPAMEQVLQVEFGFDSAELSFASRDVVKQALQFLEGIEGSIALIAGYSDNLGADQYNLSLSQRRAETVASYLADQGISRSRLRVEGRGAIQVSASVDAEGLLSSSSDWRVVEIRINVPDQS